MMEDERLRRAGQVGYWMGVRFGLQLFAPWFALGTFASHLFGLSVVWLWLLADIACLAFWLYALRVSRGG